jgi:hypothetical protein
MCDALQDAGHHIGVEVTGHLAPNIPPQNKDSVHGLPV